MLACGFGLNHFHIIVTGSLPSLLKPNFERRRWICGILSLLSATVFSLRSGISTYMRARRGERVGARPARLPRLIGPGQSSLSVWQVDCALSNAHGGL